MTFMEFHRRLHKMYPSAPLFNIIGKLEKHCATLTALEIFSASFAFTSACNAKFTLTRNNLELAVNESNVPLPPTLQNVCSNVTITLVFP